MNRIHMLVISLILALGITGFFSYRYFLQKSETNAAVTCTLSPRASKNVDNFLLGFTTLEQETNEQIPVKGKIPTWVSGTLFRVGPGQFEMTDSYAIHWLDGFAMIHRFFIDKGTVTYSNALLESEYYQKACQTGKMEGLKTNKGGSLLSKCFSSHSSNPTYDNVNVNVVQYGNQTVALTEAPTPLAFNPETLKTEKPFSFDDSIEGQFSTAHPHFDPQTNEYTGFLIHFARSSEYVLYKMKANSNIRQKIGSAKVSQPAYIHSFAITPHYIILTEHPFVVKPIDLLLSNKAFIDNFKWKPEQGTIFYVFNRDSGTLIGKYKTDAFFSLHNINAFESDNNTITLDLSTYPDAQIISAYKFDQLTAKKKICFPHARFSRFTINLDTNKVSAEHKDTVSLEMPRINYEKYNGKPYQFVYGVSADAKHAFPNQLIKMNVSTGSYSIWTEPHCFPCEPLFIANPQANTEDNGVLLSIVLDSKNKNSFVLILDAQTMKELARATVPHHIPFTVHGNFFINQNR